MRLAESRRRRKAVHKAISALAKGSKGHGGFPRAVGAPFACFVYCHFREVHAKEDVVLVVMSCNCARVTEEGRFERLPVVVTACSWILLAVKVT
jgi:hypothetical protein